MTKCRYHGQYVEETEGKSAEKNREKQPQAENGDHGDEVDVENEGIQKVERAECVKREPSTENAVSQFCLSFASTALQPVSKDARKEAKRF